MTSIDWDTFSRVVDLEIKFKKQEQIIKNILEENKTLNQELNYTKFEINLLQKQIIGIRSKITSIAKDNNPPTYTEGTN
jgi:uncharacterized coiled-coil protein SlyX